ncbi:hypothetical protein IFM89_039293 [Coptis chinensis]|uniref:Uncharacterized protein n=1 Tax=Coptis chinensis TaxID=261450 RepID=A0A835LUM9_9MAGN|nr:hypothetical protein IFM89_039293 [Coptis chinensis]
MAYKGHIKPMEDPRDWPKPLKCKLSANKNSTINETFVWFLVLDGFLCAYYLVGFEDFLVLVELNLAYVLGFGDTRTAIPSTSTHPLGGQERIEGEMKMRKHQTRREGSVGCVGQRGIIPRHAKASLHNQKVRTLITMWLHMTCQELLTCQEFSFVWDNSQVKYLALEASPKLLLKVNHHPTSPSSQPSQVPSTRSKSKVATESQPPASPSQPSTRRKSICACSNQVPTSPSSHPSTRSKSKATSSSQVPPSPSSHPNTRDKSKEIVVSQPASSQPITRGKSKETTSSQPNTRDKTKEAPEQRHTFADLMKRLRDTYMPPRAAEKLNSSSGAPPKMAEATKQNKPPLAPSPNLGSRQKFQTVRPDWKL